MQQIQLTDEQKFKVLQSQLQERYCAAHNMRERSTRFALWISGLAIGLAWLLASQPAMTLMQRIALTLLISALSTGSFVFLNGLGKGFKSNRTAMIECERSLQMYETGAYIERISLLPTTYAENNSRRWSDHFSTLIIWLSIVTLSLILLTWTCPHRIVTDKQVVQTQELLDRQDDSSWPAAATVHQWLVNATKGHTSENPMDECTCVRVRYAGQYHVDLPSYGKLKGQYLLAVKGEAKWPHSDPLALTDWFRGHVSQHGEQLRRIVRYLKAWADFQSMRRGKMPSGLILTVLVVSNFHSHRRDDMALAQTVDAISNAVGSIFFVLNPVDITEELTTRLTEPQKERFQDAVQALASDANESVVSEDDHKASNLWRKQPGDRFPLKEKKRRCSVTKQTASAIAMVHASNNPPKPWGWQ